MSVVFLRVFYTVTSFKEASGDIGFPLFAAIHCVASFWFFWSFLSFFGFHASSSEGKCQIETSGDDGLALSQSSWKARASEMNPIDGSVRPSSSGLGRVWRLCI